VDEAALDQAAADVRAKWQTEYQGGDQITLDESDERALDVAAAGVQAEIARRRQVREKAGRPRTGVARAAEPERAIV
jgi:hypothetical protein